jgi:hypothetical protein
MATRASLAARIDVARQSSEQSMARISAGIGVEVPPPTSGIVGKDPEMRSAADRERVASFLAAVAEKVGAEPKADEPEPEAAPADEHPTSAKHSRKAAKH